MITAELLLHLLIAFCLVASAFVLIWAVQVLGQLNTLSQDNIRLYEDLKEQIQELETEVHKSKKETYDSLSKLILDEARRRFEQKRPQIRVEGDELDFPNDR